MSYTGTRRIPHADGGCHIPDYWAAAQILLPDVDRANRVPMPGQATLLVRAVEHAPTHLALAPMPTPWARARRVGLLLQGDLHPAPLGLVGKFEADAAC
jgi:hypothetical protein